MSSDSHEEAVNRLMQAFRSELDEYARELLSETPRSSSKPSSSRKQVDWDDKHDRYYSPGTPRTRGLDEDDEDPRIVGVQTPNPRNQTTPPLATKSQYRTPPHAAQQETVAAKSLFTDWKSHMSKIVDTIEERDSRTKALEEENDFLARENAGLKDEMDRLHATKVKPLLNENDDLRAQLDELKMKLAAANDQARMKEESMNRELEIVQVKLREARKDCSALEAQNDKLHDRLADFKSQHNSGYSSSSARYNDRDGDRGSRYGARDYEEESYRREAPEPRSSTIPEPRGRRYAASPGEALVRDLAEKTHLDRDYLEPLSDILDRRLGRETPGKHTPGRSNGGRYGRIE